ncbi:hypothetical protein K435DRAFT_861504 [Dendrothele bispora CBS 962.96]|uniref:Uncharacterized protein n=1 Tax=Dendrothele bispora (strain CBS 962.96) TaxID=1314807 RepID=A0A4S8LUW8_DENBC|nr:hypothetical protein K435DRAFT_861504 [Dendrothele bispora CBS 962.96]
MTQSTSSESIRNHRIAVASLFLLNTIVPGPEKPLRVIEVLESVSSIVVTFKNLQSIPHRSCAKMDLEGTSACMESVQSTPRRAMSDGESASTLRRRDNESIRSRLPLEINIL